MKKIINIVLTICVTGTTLFSYAQNTPQGVSIAPTQTPPSKNAMLDVVSSDKGILVPRVEYNTLLEATDPENTSGVQGLLAPMNIESDEDGLLVFVTDQNENYGYWFFDGQANPGQWKQLSDGSAVSLWTSHSNLSDIFRTQGNVGIGITDPNEKLQVHNGAKITGEIPVLRSEDNTAQILPTMKFDANLGPNITPSPELLGYLQYLPGHCGGNPGQCFAGYFILSNDLTVMGNVSSTSDINLKTNIVPLDGALSKINSINGVSFNWINSSDTSKHIGVIAQNVELVYPELVQTLPDGTKTVNYPSLVAPLIEATKEQQQIIEAQQQRIQQLETQFLLLLQRIEALEQN